MSTIYQHFRPEEKEFIDQVIEWKRYVEDQYADKLTDFLDPRQQFIISSLIGEQSECSVQFFGGGDHSERKRAILYPEYMQPELDDFQLTLCEVNYPVKFVNIDHRMVLGTLMSLGIKREKFGDIIIHNERIQFTAANEIIDYVLLHLQQIGKAKVSVEKLDLTEVLKPTEEWRPVETTVSSLRLDAILSAGFNISRQKAQQFIQSGLAKVNWEIVEKPSFECGEGDILSVRKLGRCTLSGILGVTKKEKYRVKLGLLK